jgi:hypothetical protein
MKPYLVMVPSLRGPQPQVWYKDGTRFVTPSDIVPIEPPIELPAVKMRDWSSLRQCGRTASGASCHCREAKSRKLKRRSIVNGRTAPSPNVLAVLRDSW